MSYTAEPIIITNPSEKLLEVIKAMRERKLSKLEELRNMKSEDFTRRVILA
jgi:predicted transcriptional regulator